MKYLTLSDETTYSQDKCARMYSEIDNLPREVMSSTVPSYEYKTSQCPKGFVDIDPNQTLPYCFKILDEIIGETSWQNASLRCNNLGANLTTINSPEENNYISEALQKHGIKLSWIGIHKNGRVIFILISS